MFPLRCLSLLLLGSALVHCEDVAAETLIEMKVDKLEEEKTTEAELVVENGERKEFVMSWFARHKTVSTFLICRLV